MDIRTRENAIITVCIVAALVVFYALSAYTDLGDGIRYLVLIAIAVVLPLTLTNAYSS